jgi:hypothetical protein
MISCLEWIEDPDVTGLKLRVFVVVNAESHELHRFMRADPSLMSTRGLPFARPRIQGSNAFRIQYRCVRRYQ